MARFIFLIFLFSAQIAVAQDQEEIIVEGEMSLIKRNNMLFLLRKGTTNYIHLEGGYKRALLRELADCPIVAGMIDKNENKLPELVRAYNSCKSGANPELILEEKRWKIGLFAGVDATRATFTDKANENVRYLASTPMLDRALPQAGVEFIYKSHRVSNFIAFYGGLFYNQNEYYQVTKQNFKGPFSEYNEHSFKYNELKIPIGLEFGRPNKKKISYYARLGLVLPKVLSFSASHPRYERESGQFVSSVPPGNIVDFQRKLMVSGAAGMDLRLNDLRKIRVQLCWTGGYHKAFVLDKAITTPAPGFSSSISLLTGFIF